MRRTAKIILIAALIFSIVALSLYMVINIHHDHHEGYCPVCVRIETAVNILRGIFASAAALFCSLFFTVRAMRRILTKCDLPVVFGNPVILRVKLNN